MHERRRGRRGAVEISDADRVALAEMRRALGLGAPRDAGHGRLGPNDLTEIATRLVQFIAHPDDPPNEMLDQPPDQPNGELELWDLPTELTWQDAAVDEAVVDRPVPIHRSPAVAATIAKAAELRRMAAATSHAGQAAAFATLADQLEATIPTS